MKHTNKEAHSGELKYIRFCTHEENESIIFLRDLYLKRPDLRLEEKPQSEDWQPFIDSCSLYKEVSDPVALVAASELSLSQNYDLESSDLKLMQLLCSYREWRVYPPAWLLDAITDRFSEYLNASMKGDKRELEEFFRVNKHDFNREAKKPLTNEAILDIERFTAWFKKIHKNKARSIVSGLFPSLGINGTGLDKSHKEWGNTIDAFLVSVELEIEPTDLQKLELLEKYAPYLDSLSLEDELTKLKLKTRQKR